MIGHVGEVPEAVADRPQEHLEQVLEAEQLLADPKPHWALPPLARIQEPQDHLTCSPRNCTLPELVGGVWGGRRSARSISTFMLGSPPSSSFHTPPA